MARRKKVEESPLKTPEELSAYLEKETGKLIPVADVKKIAADGKLLDDSGKINMLEMIAFLAMFVK